MVNKLIPANIRVAFFEMILIDHFDFTVFDLFVCGFCFVACYSFATGNIHVAEDVNANSQYAFYPTQLTNKFRLVEHLKRNCVTRV